MNELLFWTVIAIIGNLLMIIVMRKAAKAGTYSAGSGIRAIAFLVGLFIAVVGTGVLAGPMGTMLNLCALLVYLLYLYAKAQNQTPQQV